MARYVKLNKDIESPTGKQWRKGETHLVSCEVAAKLVEEGATYSNGQQSELVEAIKAVKTKKKK